MKIIKINSRCLNDRYSPDLNVIVLSNSLCPKCKIVTTDSIKDCFYTIATNNAILYVVYVCGLCGEVIFQKHIIYNFKECDNVIDFSKQSYIQYPTLKKVTSFSKEINKLSTNFVEIFHQAEITEIESCYGVCGMGYRKALEFLIKDYLIYKDGTLKEAVSTESLAASIKRIEDNRVKLLAQRSTWLGNDECHYVRKQEDCDIKDLKLFITALVNFIESELIFERANSLQAKK